MRIPSHTLSKPPSMLLNRYIPAIDHIPARIICSISLEKVENVLKPPQKPVTSNSRYSGDSQYRDDAAKRAPKIIQLKILATQVPKGNCPP